MSVLATGVPMLKRRIRFMHKNRLDRSFRRSL